MLIMATVSQSVYSWYRQHLDEEAKSLGLKLVFTPPSLLTSDPSNGHRWKVTVHAIVDEVEEVKLLITLVSYEQVLIIIIV